MLARFEEQPAIGVAPNLKKPDAQEKKSTAKTPRPPSPDSDPPEGSPYKDLDPELRATLADLLADCLDSRPDAAETSRRRSGARSSRS